MPGNSPDSGSKGHRSFSECRCIASIHLCYGGAGDRLGRERSALTVRARMLELAVLGELEQPLHGYEIRKRISRSMGPFRRLSFGSLYPALHRLADQGLIQVVPDEEPAGRSAAKRGRQAKEPRTAPRRQVIYQITSAGNQFLQDALGKAAVDDESMPLTVSLMSQATPAARLAILTQRRQRVVERQQAGVEAKKSADFWVRSRGELDWQQAEAELAWIDTLIESDKHLLTTH